MMKTRILSIPQGLGLVFLGVFAAALVFQPARAKEDDEDKKVEKKPGQKKEAGKKEKKAGGRVDLKKYDSYTITNVFPWDKYREKPDSWYKSAECKEIVDNLLGNQQEKGLFQKKQATHKPLNLAKSKTHGKWGSFDDGATIPELRFLARVVRITKDPKARAAFDKGINAIYECQYPLGGWPHEYPHPPKGSKMYFARHITLNDHSHVNILWFLRDVYRDKEFDFLTKEEREKAKKAYDKGIDCLLKLQIREKDPVTGKEVLTAWCAQYDCETGEPTQARKFEHPGIWGVESFWVVRHLMSIENPSPEIKASIHAACAWIEKTKITNIIFNKRAGNIKIVEEGQAKPLWARIREIGTGKILYGNWDGSKVYDYKDLKGNRRTNFNWFSPEGTQVLEEYRVWKATRGKD